MFLTICPICRLFFSEDDEVKSTPCGHVFHSRCITEWLDRAALCPVCHQETTSDNLIRLFFDNHSIPSGSVGVDVSNRDGVFLRFLVRPPDTVGSLMKELLESHEVERIHDLRLRDRSLLFGTSTDAASLLIRDCGVREGDELLVVESPVSTCHMVCVGGDGAKRTLDVELFDGQGVPELRRRAAGALGIADPAAVGLLYLSGGLRWSAEGEQRRYARLFNASSLREELACVSPSWASPDECVKQSMLNYYSRTVLDDDSRLPEAPDVNRHSNVVKALAEVQYWKLMPSGDTESVGIRLRDSNVYFRSPNVCAWFSAHAASGGSAGVVGGTPRFFLHCFGDRCADVKTGTMYEGVREVRKAFPDARLHYCVVFVERGVVFPKFNIGDDNSLLVWVPEGLSVNVEQGSLRVNDATSKQRTPNVWVAGRTLTDQLSAYFKSKSREKSNRLSALWSSRL